MIEVMKLLTYLKPQRNLVNKLRRNAMSNFYNHKFEDSKGNMKKTWKTINGLIGYKGHKRNEEVCFIGCDRDDISATVDKFGKFFSNIGPEVQASVYDKYQEMQRSNFSDIRSEYLEMNFNLCTSDEVSKIVKSLKSNSARVDGLTLRGLKAILGYILPCLVFLINLSLEKGKFHEQFKVAKVIPLHKGG